MTVPKPTDPADVVEITLEDGRRYPVHRAIADRVVGVDADGDLLIPLGEPDRPIARADGAEWLVPLTPCCNASGKGVDGGLACRGCYRLVHSKYGMWSDIAVPVVRT